MVTKWLNSYRIYCYSIVVVHLFIFSYFFPMAMLNIITVIMIIVLVFAWCTLIHMIETAARTDLLFLIDTTNNETTRMMLSRELYELDKNSLSYIYGDPRGFGA
jgi:hypothetical protein